MSVVGVSSDGLIALMEGGWEHSALYEFMVANYERMLGAFEAKRQRWSLLCPWFAANGLTDRTGKAPNPNTARITWYRVRKAMARVQAKLDAARRVAEEAAEARRLEREQRREAAAAEAARLTARNPMGMVRRPVPPSTPVRPPVVEAKKPEADPLAEFTAEEQARIVEMQDRIRKQLRREERWRGGDYADA